jgi:hypothetical protein
VLEGKERPADALAETEQAMELARSAGNITLVVPALFNSAETLASMGDVGCALDHLQHAPHLAQQTGERQLEALITSSMGELYVTKGDADVGLGYLREACNVCTTSDTPRVGRSSSCASASPCAARATPSSRRLAVTVALPFTARAPPLPAWLRSPTCSTSSRAWRATAAAVPACGQFGTTSTSTRMLTPFLGLLVQLGRRLGAPAAEPGGETGGAAAGCCVQRREVFPAWYPVDVRAAVEQIGPLSPMAAPSPRTPPSLLVSTPSLRSSAPATPPDACTHGSM